VREYPLRVVEAMLANGCNLGSIEDFLEGRTDLSEENRSRLWLIAWSETSRENRRQRAGVLIEGERQLVGRVGAKVALIDTRRTTPSMRGISLGWG